MTSSKLSLSVLCLFWLSAVSAFTTSNGGPSSTRTTCLLSPSILTTRRRETVRVWSEESSADDGGSSDGDSSGDPPEALKTLLETPEIMALLQSQKMQEAMQLVMSGKQEELQARVQADPEFQEIVEKLSSIMGGGDGPDGP